MKKLTLATLLIISCATALTEFKPLAEQGDTLAQFAIGYMYAYGQGVPQDNR
jgi:TPR repeat protein